ncbi:MAG: SOS-response repressor and protease LexA [Ktedonobacterales bacterium]|jgi:repressor LexA|nr:MAG: SOS-response repressor and protease LexA [Ktedonobacterales bacterium]
MEAELSDPQARIYAFINEYVREHGRPPTNREIGGAVDIQSTGHVDYHLTILEKKGYIRRERKKSRGIILMHSEPRGLRIEGTIAAGVPLDIYPDARDTLDLGEHTREYVLQVRGQSMIDDHIADGDYVLVDRDAAINDGDIVVATHTVATADAGAATLKRIYKEQDRIRLQPANSTMDPIYVSKAEWDHEWEVQGKVTAVYRRF